MREFPNATLTVHPRGARHMADPARLIAGTVAVYGEAPTRQMYGDILPIPVERILETPHASAIRLAGRELQFLDTPGHARHHVAIRDTRSGHIFAGDVFGLSYREMDQDGRQFIVPTSSPAQFDPAPYHRSIDLIREANPEAVYITHYSQIRDVQTKGAVLHRLVDAHAELGLREKDAGAARPERLREGVKRIFLEEARRWGSRLPDARVLDIYSNDVELNALGLGFWLDSLEWTLIGFAPPVDQIRARAEQRSHCPEYREHAHCGAERAEAERQHGVARIHYRGAYPERFALAPGRRGVVEQCHHHGLGATQADPRAQDRATSSGTLTNSGNRQ